MRHKMHNINIGDPSKKRRIKIHNKLYLTSCFLLILKMSQSSIRDLNLQLLKITQSQCTAIMQVHLEAHFNVTIDYRQLRTLSFCFQFISRNLLPSEAQRTLSWKIGPTFIYGYSIVFGEMEQGGFYFIQSPDFSRESCLGLVSCSLIK